MSKCVGRCRCHAAAWDALDQAAGIEVRPRKPAGRKRWRNDPQAFAVELRQKYAEERAAEPYRKPSLVRVADRLLIDRRTLKSTIARLGVAWPPDPNRLRRAA